MFKIFGAPKGSFDYLIVGLGNPGREYENTRHNIGFCVLDALCKKLGTDCKKVKFKSLMGEAEILGKRCLLLKPQTFMNLSGQAVSEAMKFYKIPADNIIVIFDDVSLNVGRLRIRAKGSDGGHNGIKNITALIGTDVFPRIKIGVGKKPHPEYELKNWVLGRFPKEQAKQLEEVVDLACDATQCIIAKDIPTAMNKFNR